jgi:hypothetical protein
VELYPDAGEQIPKHHFLEEESWVRMTVYVDTDHAHDLVTRRAIAEIPVMLNNKHIRWIFKLQKTVETSTYGSELVASRISIEIIPEVRYIHWLLGVALDGPALILGDNNLEVLNFEYYSSFKSHEEET